MRYVKCLVMVSLVLALAAAAYPAVQLSGVFGDHMVLQRDMPINVWGRADAGEAIKVQLGTKTASTTAGADGKWLVTLPAMSAGGPIELTVTGTTAVAVKDILVGEVWLCSGQSNMGTGLKRREPPLDPGETNLPKVRYCGIPNALAAKPTDEAPALNWVVASKETVATMPAVPWFFGQMLHQETGVPVGILKANAGGAYIDYWLAPESMRNIPELAAFQKNFDAKLKNYEDNLPKNMKILQDWVRAAEDAKAKGQDIPPIPSVDLNPVLAPVVGGPYCMYNAMIHYLTRFPIKGAVWYQGESNADDGPVYFNKMQALIGGWRKAWNQPNMPFYFVQLPNMGGACGLPDATAKGWPLMREIQAKCLQIPYTGMAVTIDIGDEELHPRNKYDTGRRLAAIALAKDYGKKIEYTGPVFKSAETKNNTVVLSFDSVGKGLMIGKKEGTKPTVEDKQGKLEEFAIAGADKKFYAGEAVIVGNTVVVSSPQVPNPVSVRYAYTFNPAKRNLYGKNGLPVAPFRTDNW